MKRWRTTLIVGGIFAALLAYVLLVEVKKDPPADADATPTPSPVLDLDTDEVQAVQLTAGDVVVRIERAGEGWQVTAPQAGPADDFAVLLALDDLTHLDGEVVLDTLPDPATYGLDPVYMSVIVETQSGASQELQLGRQTPDQSAYYARRTGDPRLYIIPLYRTQSLLSWLQQPPYPPTPTPDSADS